MKRSTGALLVLITVLAAAYGVNRLLPVPGDSPAPPAPGEAARMQPAPPGPPPVGPGGEYLRGTHWFGDAWPVNFWNTRLEPAAVEDFAQIRSDGFNTVVLVVPWPGFVPSPDEGRLLPARAARLAALIELAAENDLNVVLRIGYGWDASVALSDRWLLSLWQEDSVRQAWVNYIGELWGLVGRQEHVRFAFISWQDLWSVSALGEEDLQERLLFAGRIGYRDWLQRYLPLAAVGERYGTRFPSWDDVPVPERTEPAFGLFLDFIDYAWVERFFKPAQAVFPTLSMEVRLDSDPVYNGPGNLAYWHNHQLAWDLPGAPWTTVYWSPAMGSENRGVKVRPERAAETLQHTLESLRMVTGNRPVFINRFAVEDFTPGNEMNDRLAPARIDDFLELAAPVLKALAHGYALSAWRDFDQNAVPSPDFSTLRGNWTYEQEDAPDAVYYHLPQGQSLQRIFSLGEFHAGAPEQAELCFRGRSDGDTAPDLLVRSNTLTQRATLDMTGDGTACVEMSLSPKTTVAVEALTDVYLAQASFSALSQPLGMRAADGSSKGLSDAWQQLNRALDRPQPAPFASLGDGWMGKSLSATVDVTEAGEALRLSLRTNLPAGWPFEPELRIQAGNKTLGTVPCSAGQVQELLVSPGVLPAGTVDLLLTVSQSYRPEGDERRLGCIVSELKLERADQ